MGSWTLGLLHLARRPGEVLWRAVLSPLGLDRYEQLADHRPVSG